DCGTAILDGVPLGFANAMPRGRIGLAAASGTGLQEVTCTLARAGEGVSQAIGVGGRDLSDEIGGVMMLRALELLAADADSRVVCVVGKPAGARDAARRLAPGQRYVRGLYAGGTLAYEAAGLLAQSLGEVALTGDGAGHRVVDLGADVFTLGRPHPMIDGGVRREWIDKEGRDAGTAVLLLDVVLGYGAHPDPAGEVLPAVRALRERR